MKISRARAFCDCKIAILQRTFANFPHLTRLYYQLLYDNETAKTGLARAVEIKPIIYADTSYGIHKYCGEIIVVYPLCSIVSDRLGFY